MTLDELRENIERVVAYNIWDEMKDFRESVRMGDMTPAQVNDHVLGPLLSLSEFLGDPVEEVCPSCGDETRPFLTMLPGGVCPHCGHVEPSDDEED